MTTTMRPVTLAAVVKRINRRLAHDNEQLHRDRGRHGYPGDLGWWYVRNRHTGYVDCYDVDPETLAREIGVLADDEGVVG
jgi:hypothetical protein